MTTIVRPKSGEGSQQSISRYHTQTASKATSPIHSPTSSGAVSPPASPKASGAVSEEPRSGYNPALHGSAVKSTTQQVAQSFKAPSSQFRSTGGGAYHTSTSYYNKAGQYVTENYGTPAEQNARYQAAKSQARADATKYYAEQDRSAYLGDVQEKQRVSAMLRGKVPFSAQGRQEYKSRLAGPLVTQPGFGRLEQGTVSPVGVVPQASYGKVSQPSKYAITTYDATKKEKTGWAERILPSSSKLRERFYKKAEKAQAFSQMASPFLPVGVRQASGFAPQYSYYHTEFLGGGYESFRNYDWKRAGIAGGIGLGLTVGGTAAKYGLYRAGLGAVAKLGGPVAGVGMAGLYVYGLSRAAKKQYTGDALKDYGAAGRVVGESVVQDILPAYVGARVGGAIVKPLRGRVEIEEFIYEQKLSPDEAASFRTLFQSVKSGRPPVENVDFSKVQRLKNKGPASDITHDWAVKHRLMVKTGGSVSQYAQGAKGRLPKEWDPFTMFPKHYAKSYARALSEGGVRGVSVKVSGFPFETMRSAEVFIGSSKPVAQFHTTRWIKSFPFSSGYVKTPEGMRLISLNEQMSRKAFGAFFADRSKDLPDFENIAKRLWDFKMEKAQNSFIGRSGRIKTVDIESRAFWRSFGKVKFLSNQKAGLTFGLGAVVPTVRTARPYAYKPYVFKPYVPYKAPAYRPYSAGKYSKYSTSYKPYAYEPYSYKPYSYKPYSYKPYAYELYSYKPYSYKPYSYKPYSYKPYVYEPYPPYSYKPYSYKPYLYEETPYVPPLLTPGFPTLDLGSGAGRGLRLFKQPRKYTPSLVAIEFKLKGPKPERITGFEIRPLPKMKFKRLKA